MTREEKIAELINIRDNFNYALTPREVFDDAIKALEREPETMKVYCVFKYKSYDHTERKFKKELVGIAKTQEGALKILKREFPYMHGCLGSENPTPDTDDVYLLEVRDIEVEE